MHKSTKMIHIQISTDGDIETRNMLLEIKNYFHITFKH